MHVKIKLLFVTFFLSSINVSLAQNFKILCDNADYAFKKAPSISMYSNLFDEYLQKNIELKKNGTYFEGIINLTKPHFIQLANTQLLAIPTQEISGLLKNDGDVFIIKDTNNINELLGRIEKKTLEISTKYNDKTSYSRFSILYDSLSQYINSITNVQSLISIKEKYRVTNEALSAIKQYCMAKLAHFSILPILYKGNYDNLFKVIQKDIQINNPSFWLQFQSGKIFLKTYFLKISLPHYKYDLKKTLESDKIFKNIDVKKLVTFHYFKSLLTHDSLLYNLAEIKKNFNEYRNKYRFDSEEQKILQQLDKKFNLTGKNIIALFSKQKLINTKGEKLESEKDDLLKNKGRMIVYYWASWCIPCIKTLNALKSDELISKGEKYKILFISVDKNQQEWLFKKYPVLNQTNSFRLQDVKNPSFYKTFQIEAFPRLFLIDNGILLNQNLPKEKLDEML